MNDLKCSYKNEKTHSNHIVALIVGRVEGQDLAVKYFTLVPSDLSVQIQPRKDLNGKNCALVKVGIGLQGVQFEGNIMGEIANKVGEYWVYMPRGCRMLKVKHPNCSPIMVTFANFGIEKLESNRTYQLTLKVSNVPQTVQQQILTIRYSPSSAMVLIDSKLIKGSNGIVKTTLPIGQHSYMVICDGYESEEGTVKLKGSSPSNLQVALNKEILSTGKNESTFTKEEQQTAQTDVTSLGESTSIQNIAHQINPTTSSFTEERITIPVKEGVCIEMVKVEKGTISFGKGIKGITKFVANVSNDYYIGKFEVTQALWQAVMGSNPAKNKGDNLPVEKVTWTECQDFIKKLNELTGKNFRLPTALEWVYAARGGSKSSGYKYSGSNKLSEVAWFDSNSKDKTHPVGTKMPNELGLYDMSGNVWEWCQDLGKSTKKSSKSLHGASRILCGGSWSDNAKYCTSLYLDEKPEGFYSIYTGMRLALSE